LRDARSPWNIVAVSGFPNASPAFFGTSKHLQRGIECKNLPKSAKKSSSDRLNPFQLKEIASTTASCKTLLESAETVNEVSALLRLLTGKFNAQRKFDKQAKP
jgi:hypothetical protein